MALDIAHDYIIIGGGTAGCVLASRLLERQSSLSILVIEAGSDVTNHPPVSKPFEAAAVHFSDIDFKYFTVPQKHLDDKPRYVCGVKALSGAVAINAGITLELTCHASPPIDGLLGTLMFVARWLDPRRRT